jgi:uncharacterized protein (TIGR00251 family)
MGKPRNRRPEQSPGTLDIRDGAEGATFKVRVQPRASRDALGGEREGALVVRLTAPPVEGAANRALTRLLGRALGVAPSAVTIVSGGGGRSKRVAVAGIDAETTRARLLTGMEG